MERVEVERMIVSSGEVGRAAPPYVFEVNLINEFRVALMPLRRRVWFLIGSALSSSILRGDSETKCLLEEVVDDGLDDDDPFFGEKACSFLP
jgi:hypothetical protein